MSADSLMPADTFLITRRSSERYLAGVISRFLASGLRYFCATPEKVLAGLCPHVSLCLWLGYDAAVPYNVFLR